MGIKLRPLIEPDKIPLKSLVKTGLCLAIDGPNMLYQLLYNPYQKHRNLITDRTQRVFSHLYGWLQKIITLYHLKCKPIVVFDGKSDLLKRQITKNSGYDYFEMKNQYQKALQQQNDQKARNFALSKSFMWINCLEESKIILEAAGIPVIMAPSEAEAQCVKLQHDGLVDYIVSTDYDLLCYGAMKIIRRLSFIKNNQVELLYPQQTLKRLNLSLFQLIDLSILLGNDYFPGIAGIGPKTALKTIIYYGSLEKVMETHPTLFSCLNLKTINHIRSLFLCPTVKKISLDEIGQRSLNLCRLRQLLLQDHLLNKERVEKLLNRLKVAYNQLQLLNSSKTDQEAGYSPNIFHFRAIIPQYEEKSPKKLSLTLQLQKKPLINIDKFLDELAHTSKKKIK